MRSRGPRRVWPSAASSNSRSYLARRPSWPKGCTRRRSSSTATRSARRRGPSSGWTIPPMARALPTPTPTTSRRSRRRFGGRWPPTQTSFACRACSRSTDHATRFGARPDPDRGDPRHRARGHRDGRPDQLLPQLAGPVARLFLAGADPAGRDADPGNPGRPHPRGEELGLEPRLSLAHPVLRPGTGLQVHVEDRPRFDALRRGRRRRHAHRALQGGALRGEHEPRHGEPRHARARARERAPDRRVLQLRPLQPGAHSMNGVMPADGRGSGRGFVLVGVVMLVLALTILGLSLFSLSSFESQFLGRSLDGACAFHAANGGLDRARFALAATESLQSVRAGLPEHVVSTTAFQEQEPGDTLTTGQVLWGGGPVVIRVV